MRKVADKERERDKKKQKQPKQKTNSDISSNQAIKISDFVQVVKFSCNLNFMWIFFLLMFFFIVLMFSRTIWFHYFWKNVLTLLKVKV